MMNLADGIDRRLLHTEEVTQTGAQRQWVALIEPVRDGISAATNEIGPANIIDF
jgi:hypothetical protein